MASGSDKTTSIHPLYPYYPVELIVVFIYGANFSRKMNTGSYPKSVQMLLALIMLFIGLATIILTMLRNKWKLRHGDFISAFIDTLVAIIAGGNLRMKHKVERWFFGIVLLGAFFLTSIFASDLLECTYRIRSQKINTFDELKDVRAPIFINRSLKMYNDNISEMIRFVIKIGELFNWNTFSISWNFNIFRQKFGSNGTFKGAEIMSKVAQNEKNCFIYVLEITREEYFKRLLLKYGRDFDVLQDVLGNI